MNPAMDEHDPDKSKKKTSRIRTKKITGEGRDALKPYAAKE
jgi:hypothetical protein